MNEKTAISQFYQAAAANDLPGALAALKFISRATINQQDDDDYDMLIQTTVNGNVCAVEALLSDKRCDLNHRENLCGMTAAEFAMDYPENSRIRQLFLLQKYSFSRLFNFFKACSRGDSEVLQAHLQLKIHPKLNENFIYPMPPGFLLELPLATAVKANSVDCVKLLLEYGAVPDAFCRNKQNQCTPRELAAEKPEILELFK